MQFKCRDEIFEIAYVPKQHFRNIEDSREPHVYPFAQILNVLLRSQSRCSRTPNRIRPQLLMIQAAETHNAVMEST